MAKKVFEKSAKLLLSLILIIVSMLLSNCSDPSQKVWNKIETDFQNPPNDAKPRVWWHWMNGNITQAGIRSDLEWMHRVGIGGFQNFDAGLTSPQIVEKRLVFMTPEWKDAFRLAAKLADSLNLEMAIAGSPGWSESGGPWVKPEEAMKKFVWSEIRIEGGKPVFRSPSYNRLQQPELFRILAWREEDSDREDEEARHRPGVLC